MTDITEPDLNPKQSIILRLPPELVAEVDERAKDKKISRNEWYERMTRWVLDNVLADKPRA